MSESPIGTWSIRRGALAFAVEVCGTLRLLPGERVRWTREDPTWCGVASADPRPIGVADVAARLRLPAAPLADDAWALVCDDPAAPWALASDVEPVAIERAVERPVPSLAGATARRLIRRALSSNGATYLVVDPRSLPCADAAAEATITDERIAARLSQLAASAEPPACPDLLVARIGDHWCGLEARSVYMVVRVREIDPLPGAERIVWGLTAVAGRVNMILDPARVLGGPWPAVPCWVAEVQTPGAKWGIAASGEWSVLDVGEAEPVEVHASPPGPRGLVSRQVRRGADLICLLAIDWLAEAARGVSGEGAP